MPLDSVLPSIMGSAKGRVLWLRLESDNQVQMNQVFINLVVEKVI